VLHVLNVPFAKETIFMLKDAPIVPYIPVSEMARARKFYEEKVGLKPREEYAG
jgi:predicted enzyme related to lactoylglutathione lyase